MSLFNIFFLHCVTVPGLSLAGCMIKWVSGWEGVILERGQGGILF